MISYDYKCIFVHIPKNGGSSIEDILWPTPADRTEKMLWMGLVNDYENKYQTGGLQHLLATQIKQEVGAELFDHCFKFSMVRNPWDRAVSQYAYMKRRPDLRRLIGMRPWTSFKRYLSLIQKKEHVQWEAQSNFIFDESGKLCVDYVARFEDFEGGVRQILSELAQRTGRVELRNSAIPHSNQSNRAAYQSYYDDESREIVRNLYQDDIEMLGYEYGTAAPIPPPFTPELGVRSG